MADVNYITTIPLGKVKGWGDKRASTMTPVSFPGLDASETEGIDTLGIIAFYDFTGEWTGTFNTIQGYINLIKAILDGNQTSSSRLRSPFVNAFTDGTTSRRGSMRVNTSTNTNQLIDSSATFVADGVQAGDLVKNLTTGNVAQVSAVTDLNTLTLASWQSGSVDIFPDSGVGYAVTASINTKLLNFEVRWELPGLSICSYKLSLMQVK